MGHVTSFARLNLIGMGKNMFPLTLVLAGMLAASQAQGNSNHLSGQTSLYLKRAVSQPVDWYPWGWRRFSTGKTAQPPDSIGRRGRLVSVVYPHGSRNVHQCLDCRLHQSAFRRGKG